MTPREAFGVVVRSFGLAVILYGLDGVAKAVIGTMTLESAMSGGSESIPLSSLFGISGSITTNLTHPVLSAGLAFGCVALVVGSLLIRWSSKLAQFDA